MSLASCSRPGSCAAPRSAWMYRLRSRWARLAYRSAISYCRAGQAGAQALHISRPSTSAAPAWVGHELRGPLPPAGKRHTAGVASTPPEGTPPVFTGKLPWGRSLQANSGLEACLAWALAWRAEQLTPPGASSGRVNQPLAGQVACRRRQCRRSCRRAGQGAGGVCARFARTTWSLDVLPDSRRLLPRPPPHATEGCASPAALGHPLPAAPPRTMSGCQRCWKACVTRCTWRSTSRLRATSSRRW